MILLYVKKKILRQQLYLRKQHLNDVSSQSIIDPGKSFKVLKLAVIISDTFYNYAVKSIIVYVKRTSTHKVSSPA